uniref:Design construct XXA_GVDQ n=1 Tax=synthetic construct TaxID=32630 RepID=UPI00144A4C39|nr:Chain A, Design construct XXA_GVDQ [synthetic construct]6NZ1_B Chain B, Design construct XXA_GVDQ [synthetic construct]6NZ1_C Chain C, Design construct XXA_GVDQ [synthetic construct]6NZ1_D Chain D, Design construct XXA_GVDQ [synthetic construct]6NZ1_E Chain E, Design construct XXA_GVDQ [synthetic construct]6NZ1_F Chain F, Design construct XXA_GVDQ [synthetic construct]
GSHMGTEDLKYSLERLREILERLEENPSEKQIVEAIRAIVENNAQIVEAIRAIVENNAQIVEILRAIIEALEAIGVDQKILEEMKKLLKDLKRSLERG